jgi:hypothetical protein
MNIAPKRLPVPRKRNGEFAPHPPTTTRGSLAPESPSHPVERPRRQSAPPISGAGVGQEQQERRRRGSLPADFDIERDFDDWIAEKYPNIARQFQGQEQSRTSPPSTLPIIQEEEEEDMAGDAPATGSGELTVTGQTTGQNQVPPSYTGLPPTTQTTETETAAATAAQGGRTGTGSNNNGSDSEDDVMDIRTLCKIINRGFKQEKTETKSDKPTFPKLIQDDKDQDRLPTPQEYDIFEVRVLNWVQGSLKKKEYPEWMIKLDLALNEQQEAADEKAQTFLFQACNAKVIRALGSYSGTSGRQLMSLIKGICAPEGFFVDDAWKKYVLNPDPLTLQQLADGGWQEWLTAREKVAQKPLNEELETAFDKLTGRCSKEFKDAMTCLKTAQDMENVKNFAAGRSKTSWLSQAEALLRIFIGRLRTDQLGKDIRNEHSGGASRPQGDGSSSGSGGNSFKRFLSNKFGKVPKHGTKQHKEYVKQLAASQAKIEKHLNHVTNGKGKGKGGKDQVCPFFLKGSCKFGKDCWKSHDVAKANAVIPAPASPPAPQPAPQPASSSTSPPVVRLDDDQMKVLAAALVKELQKQ